LARIVLRCGRAANLRILVATVIAKKTQYAIDSKVSQFTVQAFASGLISSVAHSPKIAIRGWTGDVRFIPGTLGEANLKINVRSDSLQVLDEMGESDKRKLHRVMYEEVLEVSRFPEISFESSHIGVEKLRDNLSRVNVEGQLTLHGVTKGETFFSQVAMSDGSFRAYGEFSLLQSDYSIRIASIAGGTMKLQDELKFSFYVVAHKEEQKAFAAAAR
jgi:polyisoprenoid-binding protein YceI